MPALSVRANVPFRQERLPVKIQRADLPGVGYWPHVHAPDEVGALLERFLAALPG